MAWAKLSVRSGLLVSILMWTVSLTGGDTKVSCVFLRSCVLPCSFQAASEEIIHWVHQTGEDHAAHSYYTGQDHVDHQWEQFRGRTSLFHDEISRGNASLQLSGVTIQDAGKYKCYTSTTTRGNAESFIILNVEAPVHKVDIQLIDDTITCTSKGIYPQPQLTWATEPPSRQTLRNSTTVQTNNQGLYNINSSLVVTANGTQVVYICYVSTATRTRSATVRQLPPVLGSSNSGVSIPCRDSDAALKDFNLCWIFNHEEHILSYLSTETQPRVHGKWETQVKGVSEEGSLELHASTAGTYTCELSVAEETYVTNTDLKIENPHTGGQNPTGAIIGGVVACVVVASVVILYILIKKGIIPTCRENTSSTSNNQQARADEDDPLRGGGPDESNSMEMEEVP